MKTDLADLLRACPATPRSRINVADVPVTPADIVKNPHDGSIDYFASRINAAHRMQIFDKLM